ncbi:hypothetical protein HA402_013227 [Bradysia odoriphaga]|nr:hypothetical protein HA402_013227 [Bradysia odoriphaga]
MGRCVGPNICECYNGYHKNEIGQCVPKCTESCVNGWCSEPEVCSCNPGYELDKTDKYKCYPNCTTPCIQGRCTAPDVCDCHPGYEFKNGSKNECLPICDFCESGNCTGPSKCTCWDNYEEQEIVQGTNIVKICQPKCMDECINGFCIEVDTCTCKKGYEFVKDSFNVCEPVCDPPCDNGDCVAPDVCLCDHGYKLLDGQCQAHCDNECINGACVYPNQCECNDGYVFASTSANVCEAFCQNCTNGICVEPNICECSIGFSMTERNVCEKLCAPECISGKCVDGICICDNGLQLFNGICVVITTTESQDVFATTDTFETEAEMTSTTTEYIQCSCESEECEGVNNCIPVCGINKEGCINGTCISPGVCKCFDGFELYPSSPYECVLEKIAAIESAPVKAYITNYISLILVLLIVALTGTTLILWLSRRNRKVNYNVDEKEKRVGVNGDDYVHYVINKDDNAFA